MSTTFKAFDPVTIYHKSNSTACETCYSRKVKCEVREDGPGCRQCADHSIDCVPRTRKRKAQASDEERQDHDQASGAVEMRGSRLRTDADVNIDGARTRFRSTSNAGPEGRPAGRENSIATAGLFGNPDTSNRYPSEDTSPAVISSRTRNASYLSRSAILRGELADVDHTHGDSAADERNLLPPTTMKVLRLYDAFKLPPVPLQQSLIEAFAKRCYTWTPVMDSAFFNARPSEVSLLLLQSVILAGSLIRPQVCEMGFSERQYERVKALIHSGYEQDPLTVLAAMCVVQNYAVVAPRRISVDMPRAWNIMAIGLAHQLGLHRPSPPDHPQAGLRNRIWWTLVWRDNFSSSCHGRPRVLQPEDCTVPPPSPQDFEDPADPRADIFCRYVEVIGILGDLCLAITRRGEAKAEDRHAIASRLFDFVTALPESLRLYRPDVAAYQYKNDLAQLHVPILITLVILFRPRTVHQLAAPNAASVTAAFLLFRLFEAIQLREHTRYLSSGYGWYFLVTAMPLLSCTKVPALRNEADQALDSLEGALETLGEVKPAAENNLRNVRAIRKVMASKSRGPASTPNIMEPDRANIRFGRQILQTYGLGAVRQYERFADVLAAQKSSMASKPWTPYASVQFVADFRPQVDQSAHAAAHTLSCLSGRQNAPGMLNGQLTPEADAYVPAKEFEDDMQNPFTAVFEDETLMGANTWMMRDWMDEWPI